MEAHQQAIPTSSTEITCDWLTFALSTSFPELDLKFVDIVQIGQGYGLASELYRCALNGISVPNSVIVKLWDTEGPGGTHEVKFYECFGSELTTAIPRSYFGVIDEAKQRGVLILEDIRDVRQGDCLERIPFERAAALANILAELHAAWWQHPKLASESWLPSKRSLNVTSDWIESRREALLLKYGALIDPFSRTLLQHAGQALERSNQLLADAPDTLLHGDFHLDNVLFDDTSATVHVLDWASTGVGSAAVDVFELLFNIGFLEDFDRLFAHYRDRLGRHEKVQFSVEQLSFQLEGVLLRNFVRYTCGLANWPSTSEREHRIAVTSIKRMTLAVNMWNERNPELFRF